MTAVNRSFYTAVLISFRGLASFPPAWGYPNRIYSRQDVENAKSGSLISLRFSRDIPSFGCGSAALGSWWLASLDGYCNNQLLLQYSSLLLEDLFPNLQSGFGCIGLGGKETLICFRYCNFLALCAGALQSGCLCGRPGCILITPALTARLPAPLLLFYVTASEVANDQDRVVIILGLADC
jgi:hypothetical protein